jgi:hypothetical protein
LLKPREKPNEKVSEKPSEKPCGELSEKPCEEPHPKPKSRSIYFHCEFCGKDGHKKEFCYKKRRAARMAKEWANKDRYHLSHDVPKPRVQLPRAKVSVRTVPAWGERKAVRGVAGQAIPVRPVQAWIGSSLGFVLVQMLSLVQEVVVLVVGLESLQKVSLLNTLLLVLNTGMGGVVAWSWKGGTVHGFLFVVLVLLWLVRGVSYGPPWAHYLGGYQDRLLGGPLGLPDLRCMAPAGVKHKDYRGEVLG